MKKLAVFLIMVPVLLIMNGCNFDPYDGKRPFDYGAAKWISEEPSAWFVVDPDDDEYYYPKGEIVIDNQAIQVRFRFINQTNRIFIDLINSNNSSNITGYNDVIDGECTFSPEKLIIKIEPEKDTLFHGQYDTITFVRKPAE